MEKSGLLDEEYEEGERAMGTPEHSKSGSKGLPAVEWKNGLPLEVANLHMLQDATEGEGEGDHGFVCVEGSQAGDKGGGVGQNRSRVGARPFGSVGLKRLSAAMMQQQCQPFDDACAAMEAGTNDGDEPRFGPEAEMGLGGSGEEGGFWQNAGSMPGDVQPMDEEGCGGSELEEGSWPLPLPPRPYYSRGMASEEEQEPMDDNEGGLPSHGVARGSFAFGGNFGDSSPQGSYEVRACACVCLCGRMTMEGSKA